MVDLIWISEDSTAAWAYGRTWAAEPTVAGIAAATKACIRDGASEAVLFWDARLGYPDRELLDDVRARPGDMWHAGLLLGQGGRPGLIDFVHPVWLFNRDAAPDQEATSWRISLRACLVKRDMLRQLGGPLVSFESLAGASLEMGHRYLQAGAMPRHVPDMFPGTEAISDVLPLIDELRFLRTRFGPAWVAWAVGRALVSGYARPMALLRAWREMGMVPSVRPTLDRVPARSATEREVRVSVLIPTIERYPYLRTVLDQLRRQSVAPWEVIVVDQTPVGERNERLYAEFGDLPLQVLYQDTMGQCTSRNAGLNRMTGTHVLLLDDDVEVPSDYIARHLNNLAQYGADVSSGVVHEIPIERSVVLGAPVRASDVFPAGNTLLKREVLKDSGLFDLAYDKGQRADGDLGMRIYLAGRLMVLDTSLSILHHRAPHGGLRRHGARKITYASSRRRLTHRHLPSVSELYLADRYFSSRQCREMLWMRVAGTVGMRGGPFRKALKVIIGLLLLPDTCSKMRRRRSLAQQMSETYPRIPQLAVL